MTIGRDVALASNRVQVNGDNIGLVNNDFAYCFKEACLSATGGSDIEHNMFCGKISTFMRALTSKDGDLLSQFDKTYEAEAENENTSVKHLLINNHDVAANKGKIKGQLQLEYIFGFCKTFKKTTKQLRFQLTFKTADLQDIIFTTHWGKLLKIFLINYFYKFQYSFLMLKHR